MRKGFGLGSLKVWLAPLVLVPLVLAGCRGNHHGNMTEAQLAERMEDVAEYALDHVDATEQQTAQVNSVLRGAAPDLVAFRREHRELSAKLRAELAKDTIDRAQVEVLRQEGLDLADRASARAGQALLDAAEKLNGDQRRKLTDKWAKHHK